MSHYVGQPVYLDPRRSRHIGKSIITKSFKNCITDLCLNMGFDFQKYRRPLVMGSIFAMLSLVYTFRLDLIGDISKEKQDLLRQTDVSGSNKIKETIRETQLDYFRNLSGEKK
ncbi:hypothetical protein C7M84_010722 [Penaeus vannamei]|uniref:Uncharacterized protein n=1 Tax=Penaeus vannamei TaxID=6689 RepID=A0A423T3L3_PENVA|nr:uncharacterized protein LOC113812795 [Penaeus vannamei]ROT70975.1 hypothetical protein C7M84_010722 [Penaeus vannamei]